MKLDTYDFYCPECDNQLDEKGVIHLKTLRKNGDIGDIYLSTNFGDYKYRHEPPTNFEENELVEFSCPKCNSMLHSMHKPNFVCMTMRVEKKFDFEILFSRKSGVQKTYIVTEDGVECYGKDCEI